MLDQIIAADPDAWQAFLDMAEATDDDAIARIMTAYVAQFGSPLRFVEPSDWLARSVGQPCRVTIGRFSTVAFALPRCGSGDVHYVAQRPQFDLACYAYVSDYMTSRLVSVSKLTQRSPSAVDAFVESAVKALERAGMTARVDKARARHAEIGSLIAEVERAQADLRALDREAEAAAATEQPAAAERGWCEIM